MAARDDSVIRGSLITCIILLVLSLALNFLVWSWGDRQAKQEQRKSDELTNARNSIRELEEKVVKYEAMMGVGQLSQAEFDSFEQGGFADANFNKIAQSFHTHMQVFGPDVGMEGRNYAQLPEYFVNTIRSRNEDASRAVAEATRVRSQAKSDVDTARAAQQKAETEREKLAKDLDDATVQFTNYRNDMLQKMESAKDSKTKSERRLQEMQRQAGNERNQLAKRNQILQSTIDTQKIEIGKLRNERFESVQGEIRYVIRGGKSGTQLVSINLGSADALRKGITFGVIDRDETSRLQDARVKASIQVTAIRGPHLAEARVVAVPEIGNPIIVGDAVYSPFWAPGRTVRIALAGPIDTDDDGRPDNETLEGLIASAGAEVVAEADLDPTVRFMVVGEAPELDGPNEDVAAVELAKVGQMKQRAIELGITVIPAWKLEAYLQTLDDSTTTPLGSAVRGDDFPPERNMSSSRRFPTELPALYMRQRDNVQRTNEIVRP